MYVKFVKRSKQLKIRCGTVLCRYRIVSRFLCIRKKLPLAGSADAGSLAEYDFHKKSFNFSMLYSSNFRSLSIRSPDFGIRVLILAVLLDCLDDAHAASGNQHAGNV